MPGKPPVAGSASEVPICYNVRLNLTTEEANRVPIEKPSSYDPMQHELLARALEGGPAEKSHLHYRHLPNGRKRASGS